MRAKHAQSAMESAMLITFMTALLIVFLALGTQKLLDVRATKDIALIEDVGEVIDAELKLATAAQEGYIRVFELPYSIGGHNYTVLLENNSAVYISYAGYLDDYTAVVLAGRNINGTIRPGPNRLTKTNTTILITPFCWDDDNDGYENMRCYGNDCDDANANINPGKFDICGNGVDEDCTGSDAACGALSCAIRSPDCNIWDGETDVMHISLYGGHAELPSQTNYNQKVCCSRLDGGVLDTTCDETTLAKLSAETNAHVEKSTLTNYLFNACMSASDTKTVVCGYAANCAAAGYMTCLFTMSSDTNAMVSDCLPETSFATAVCCSTTDGAAAPCTLSSASISLNDANTNSKADAGETVTISGTISGDCSQANHFQIDARSSDGTCNIQYTGGDMSGITKQNPSLSGTTISGTWTIPTVPPDCQGKTVSATTAGLWNGAPGTGTLATGSSSVAGSLSFATITQETGFYVSPSGNDNNPGTESRPFKTITKARDVVRTLNINMQGDIVVYLRGEVHTLTTPLLLNQDDSGMNGFNVIYRNYPGEYPLISGGQLITGWIQDGDKWKTYVGTSFQTRQLYVNGARAIRARSVSGLPDAQETLTGYTYTPTAEFNLQNWGNIRDVEIVDNNNNLNHGGDRWYRCNIDLIDGNTIEMQQPCWSDAQLPVQYDNDSQPIPTSTMGLPDWIENAFELLDADGEWYLNRESGWLYYKPGPGEDMGTATVIAPVLETLVKGEGASNDPIRNIQFKGISFAYATSLGPSSARGWPDYWANAALRPYPPPPAEPTDGTLEQAPANVMFKKAMSIRIERNIFIRLGSDALGLGEDTQDSEIVGNHFYDISGNAIQLGGLGLEITGINRNNLISNNYIHKIGVEYKSGVGIQVGSLVQDAVISHNEITDVPSSGIIIGWHGEEGTANNLVKNNLIQDHMKEAYDGGGIYSAGQKTGIVITENVVKNQRNFIGGLYLDLDSRYKEVSSNVAVDNRCCNGFFNGGDHYIHDNWWQDRGNRTFPETDDSPIPDIWIFMPRPDFGPITLQNNNVITDENEAPVEIVNNAGLEAEFIDIKTLP